jgi:predicted extracellular nuclease
MKKQLSKIILFISCLILIGQLSACGSGNDKNSIETTGDSSNGESTMATTAGSSAPESPIDSGSGTGSETMSGTGSAPETTSGTGTASGTSPDECPGSIYDIQQGKITVECNVSIENAVVTGLYTTDKKNQGFTVQDPCGGKFSGIYVYTKTTAPTVKLGDEVSFTGKYVEYPFTVKDTLKSLSEIQLTGPVTVSEIPGEMPVPVTLNPADIATGANATEDWEGVLVRVENVAVINANPDGSKNYGEFSVTGNLRVDDAAEYSYQATLGDQFASITGVLHYSFENYKLEPRNDADFVPCTDCVGKK